MREHAPDSRAYEMMVVITPTVAEEGLPAVIERVSGYIAANGGTVTSTSHENPWGRRRLAYQINDFRDAFYVLYMFDGGAQMIDNLERDLRLDEQVLRHLVVRYDPMTEHEERPPRGEAPRRPQPASTPAPAEATPAQATSAEPAPAETAATEATPAEATPAEAAPEEAQPATSE